MCHSRHPIYLIFSSLGVMPRVPTALHLFVAHGDITRQLANCNENYKFSIYPYNILKEFAVNSDMIVTSHPEIVITLGA